MVDNQHTGFTHNMGVWSRRRKINGNENVDWRNLFYPNLLVPKAAVYFVYTVKPNQSKNKKIELSLLLQINSPPLSFSIHFKNKKGRVLIGHLAICETLNVI